MRLRGDNLKSVYKTFVRNYRSQVGSTFKWKSGEKGRVKNIFTYVSEAMGIREEAQFDTVLEMFHKYIVKKTKEWKGWNKRSRNNYLGFLEKREEVEVFVSGEMESGSEQDLDMAGTEDEEDWEF